MGKNIYDVEKAPKNGKQSIRISKISVHDEKTNGETKKDDLKDPEVDIKDPNHSDAPPPPEKTSLFELFRFADAKDRLLILLGTLAAMIVGSGTPVNVLIYGQVIDIFVETALYKAARENVTNSLPPNTNESIIDEILRSENITYKGSNFDRVKKFLPYFIINASVVLLFGIVQMGGWMLSAERQTRVIRKKTLNKILRMHIGWFDTNPSGELNTKMTEGIKSINDGIGEKLATFIQWFTTFIVGYIMGFVRGWKLALVIISTSPLIAVCIVFIAKVVRSMTTKEIQTYAKAGAIAEEALSSIRIVSAFGGEDKEAKRYDGHLEKARNMGVKKNLLFGLGQGTFWIVLFGTLAIAFWFGSKLVREEELSPGEMIQVLFNILMGTIALGNAMPNIEQIAQAQSAAAAVYKLIDLESEIDSASNEGHKPVSVEGDILLENIHFNYPSRPDVQILKGLSLRIEPGKTVAFVGPSGCGKSTVVQLLMRLYNIQKGRILLDSNDITTLNTKWLRHKIGIVSQEPILFATSILENIRFGCEGATEAQVIEAAKNANAHDFISRLPDSYNTMVGERGAQLSGGQKQRIALARALVSNPKILFLDEATSALDTQSEAIVQKALDKASKGRTTLVIAHRLSTVRNADLIVAISEGVVAEQGTHDELMEKGGLYSDLVKQQIQEMEGEGSDDDEEEVTDVVEEKIPLAPKRLTSMRRSSAKRRLRSQRTVSVQELEKEEEQKLPEAPLSRIVKINSPEWFQLVMGSICALLNGVMMPMFSLLFSEFLGNFSKPEDVQKRRANLYAVIMASFGFAGFLFVSGRMYLFGVAGENLTMRLRQMAFKSMLRMEMGYFDDQKNQVGALTSRLAIDAANVKGAVGSQLSTVFFSLANAGTAVIVGFVFSWKLSLLILVFTPPLLLSGIVQGKIVSSFNSGGRTAVEGAQAIASEAISQIRTVVQLTREDYFEQRYGKFLDEEYGNGKKKSLVFAFTYAFAQSVLFYAYAAAFGLGSKLVDDGLEYTSVFRVFSALTIGAQSVGRSSAFSLDYGKAKLSASKLFALFDRKSEIDPTTTNGVKPTTVKGSIVFQDVKFRYPTRLEVPVLQGLNLSVEKGQTLALVGSSGCGKSTTISLLERFYNPRNGIVTLDGEDISNYNTSYLRSKIGIVTQEPTLFDCSIAENIAYGDNSKTLSMTDIIEAAKSANIHNFIQTLPMGYDTNVGAKGTQLSGGQKQRIAIARALVRDPVILLLDEATSALDAESEKVVQEALEKAQKGRTCIVIAHRLSTIQNSDSIAVIDLGRVVEQGSHQQLLNEQGFYYDLQQAQAGNKKKED
ncbi:DgyrCDS9743 [Dimorphilus gyrociliatus]|uniref:DgyrCDS9743 n=1 Tax=Dimorphilus gyrociliatus TaxID=2664684 RepID=A0A7I8W0L4_9ANNE|nr:DgyrCDS9743 [Dimorphilus gyrociliatus]